MFNKPSNVTFEFHDISSKLKRIVDLLWYYWEFNFNVDVGRREDLDLRCEKMTLLGKPGNFSQIVLPVFKGSG